MKGILKKVFKAILYLLGILIIAILVLAFWPTEWKIENKGITPEKAAVLRQNYSGPHAQFTTVDGETLFLRRWNADSIEPAKKDIAVLLFHGFTAHSGAYNMAGEPISKAGYTVFGLDYRGHGLSGGNRGDNPGKDRWIGDLAEAVKQVKTLGFSRVIVMGHSLGVAAAMYAADSVPNEIAGLVLLSGAYESRKGVSTPIPFMKKMKLLSSAIIRPSYRAVEYNREGMTVSEDTLFNFRYTPRFVTMLDVKTLRLPSSLNIPVLVGVGDKDELFEIDKVKELYNLVPGNKKEFFIMTNATHAKIPVESWEEIARWLDKTFVGNGERTQKVMLRDSHNNIVKTFDGYVYRNFDAKGRMIEYYGNFKHPDDDNNFHTFIKYEGDMISVNEYFLDPKNTKCIVSDSSDCYIRKYFYSSGKLLKYEFYNPVKDGMGKIVKHELVDSQENPSINPYVREIPEYLR